MKYFSGVIAGGLLALSTVTTAFACSGSLSKSVGATKSIGPCTVAHERESPAGGTSHGQPPLAIGVWCWTR